MGARILALPARELLQLLRAEEKHALGAETVTSTAWIEHVAERIEEPGGQGAPQTPREQLCAVAKLNVTPQGQSDGWQLLITAQTVLAAPVASDDDLPGRSAAMTLEEFDGELTTPGRKRVSVRLFANTAPARRQFDRWLSDLRARHHRRFQLNADSPLSSRL